MICYTTPGAKTENLPGIKNRGQPSTKPGNHARIGKIAEKLAAYYMFARACARVMEKAVFSVIIAKKR